MQSNLASRLSAGFLFHIRPSFTGPSTLQPYDITCGPQSDLLFSHTLFLVLFLHLPAPRRPHPVPLLFFFAEKRSLIAFPERVGGVCVWNMFLCVSCTTAGMSSQAKKFCILRDFILRSSDQVYRCWPTTMKCKPKIQSKK